MIKSCGFFFHNQDCFCLEFSTENRFRIDLACPYPLIEKDFSREEFGAIFKSKNLLILWSYFGVKIIV